MKVCVLGAGGLIGRSLIKRLTALSGIEITGFGRHPMPDGMLPIRWLQGDLENFDDCKRALEGQEVVIHLAHTNSPLTSDTDVVKDARLNLIPTLTLLKAIGTLGHTPHLIFPSSGGAIYGASVSGKRFKETDPCLPLNSYGIQKLMAEQYIRLFAHRRILTATVLRISNTYGWLLPPNRSQGFIGTAVMRILSGQPIRIFGNPLNVRDYIHIEDVVEAFLLTIERQQEFEIYNVGTGAGTSVKGVIEIFEKLLRHPVGQIAENLEIAKQLLDWCVLDTEKARAQLGWHSKIGLEDGIRRMLDLAVEELKG